MSPSSPAPLLSPLPVLNVVSHLQHTCPAAAAFALGPLLNEQRTLSRLKSQCMLPLDLFHQAGAMRTFCIRKPRVAAATELATTSVATMVIVCQQCPDISVPTVYAYVPTRDNAVGLPFSVISYEALPLGTKLIGVRNFARIVAQLHFRATGSISFKFSAAATEPESATAARATSTLSRRCRRLRRRRHAAGTGMGTVTAARKRRL
ncbi:hypothetical protein GGX14DRAFT_638064 [Mycena pura]|uniref:Uncharacterized protein n=1 Tax=Mycena pura TaxID=153505 RepID=A0AAD6VI16_9AGAR|nr:hypothetical protein GGX14DRAFT_394953 [Mycena pura]KAJ7225285.1 hypothetical protein GGX14DRAFT_638064 [Mycena pura]